MAISIDDLLRRAVENKASDLHLKVGNHPYLRVDGLLAPQTDVARVTPEEMLSMAFSMMTNRQKQKFKETAELDMAYGVAGLGRFRVNVFQQRGNVGMVLRVIPTKIRTTDELNLPAVINRSEEHTSELQSHSDLHSFPTRRSSDLPRQRLPAARQRRHGLARHPHQNSYHRRAKSSRRHQ